jgi:hypothetical protein
VKGRPYRDPYNDPAWLVSRHAGDADLDRIASEMALGLAGLTRAATQSP